MMVMHEWKRWCAGAIAAATVVASLCCPVALCQVVSSGKAYFSLSRGGRLLVTDMHNRRAGQLPGPGGATVAEIPGSNVSPADGAVVVPNVVLQGPYELSISGSEGERSDLAIDVSGDDFSKDHYEAQVILPESGAVKLIVFFMVVEGNAWVAVSPDSDKIPPNMVTGLFVKSQCAAGTHNLGWKAPGERGSFETANAYSVRWMAGVITDANWASATPLPGVPSPVRAWRPQEMPVTAAVNAGATTFAMKATNADGKTSLLSNVAYVDRDCDGLPDYWEMQYFGTLARDGSGDFDADGLSDASEYNLGSNPANPDTDGDVMPDGWEAANALNLTSNDAGLDADGDGYSNLIEYQAGTNPRDAASKPEPTPTPTPTETPTPTPEPTATP